MESGRYLKMAASAIAIFSYCGEACCQEAVYKGFADVQYHLSPDAPADVGFKLGQFDHFISARITDNLSLLTETVFEYDGGWILDVERVQIRYTRNDYAKLTAGKLHTPIGFWNDRFHHGSLLQTSIDRPIVLRFEDEGGILPIHTLGAMVSGSGMGPMSAGYFLLVGNGIGSDPASDNDKWKSVTVNIHMEPAEALQIGISGYLDKIYRDAEGAALPDPLFQTLISGHIVYRLQPVEILAEYFLVQNGFTHSGKELRSHGGYILGSRQFDSFRPYFKYDMLAIDPDESFFPPGTKTGFTLGIRYDHSYQSAVKFEGFQEGIESDSDSYTALGVRTQICVGF